MQFLGKPWEFKVKFEAFRYRCICIWPGEGGRGRQGRGNGTIVPPHNPGDEFCEVSLANW